MNKLTIIGNATADATLRTTQNGVSVCSFSVAVRGKGKNKENETTFFNVTAWRALGETCAKYVKKGKKVCVVGPVSISTYDSKNGEKRSNLAVTADDVEFLSPRSEDEGSGYSDNSGAEYGGAGYQQDEIPQSGGYTDVTNSVEVDELPF